MKRVKAERIFQVKKELRQLQKEKDQKRKMMWKLQIK